jgi:insulysin
LEPVLETLDEKLSSQLKELGLSSSSDIQGVANGNGETQKAVVITDVPTFKASLPVSTGPVPVTDLSEYEDFDAKL